MTAPKAVRRRRRKAQRAARRINRPVHRKRPRTPTKAQQRGELVRLEHLLRSFAAAAQSAADGPLAQLGVALSEAANRMNFDRIRQVAGWLELDKVPPAERFVDGRLADGFRWCPECNGEGEVWRMDGTPNLDEHREVCTYRGCAAGHGIIVDRGDEQPEPEGVPF